MCALTFVASSAAPHRVAVAADELLREAGDAFAVDALRLPRILAAHPIQVGAAGVSSLRLAVQTNLQIVHLQIANGKFSLLLALDRKFHFI